MKKRITQDDYVKANRKASREAEIEMYGHPICHKRVHQSKKVYNRRKIKAADKKLPYFFVFKIAHYPPDIATLYNRNGVTIMIG